MTAPDRAAPQPSGALLEAEDLVQTFHASGGGRA